MSILSVLYAATGVCPSVSDVGYVAGSTSQSASVVVSATQWALVYVALMEWQRRTTGDIADMRRTLADRRMVMAEEALAHAKLTWEKEIAFVNETMDTSAPVTIYNTVVAAGNAFETSWETTDLELDRVAAKFAMPLGLCEDARVSRAMAIGKTDLMANAMRVAEARSLALGDRRYSRQYAVLAMGRGKMREATAMGTLAAAGSTVRNAVLGSINAGMSLWGFQDHRWYQGTGWTPKSAQVTNMWMGNNRVDTAPPVQNTIVLPEGFSNRSYSEAQGA
jgi:hypothetical protein